MNQNESSLTHYGVKGMRWGVRNEPDKGASKTMKKMAEKYKGKIAKKQDGKAYRLTTHATADHSKRDRTGKSTYKVHQIEYKYNSTSGKIDKNYITSEHESTSDNELNRLLDEAYTDYDAMMAGEKPKTYMDADGNIWQWDAKAGDYIRVGGTKGKAKETMKYKISQLTKKANDSISKAVDSGKKFLTKLFNVKKKDPTIYSYGTKTAYSSGDSSLSKTEKKIKKRAGSSKGWNYVTVN